MGVAPQNIAQTRNACASTADVCLSFVQLYSQIILSSVFLHTYHLPSVFTDGRICSVLAFSLFALTVFREVALAAQQESAGFVWLLGLQGVWLAILDDSSMIHIRARMQVVCKMMELQRVEYLLPMESSYKDDHAGAGPNAATARSRSA